MADIQALLEELGKAKPKVTTSINAKVTDYNTALQPVQVTKIDTTSIIKNIELNRKNEDLQKAQTATAAAKAKEQEIKPNYTFAKNAVAEVNKSIKYTQGEYDKEYKKLIKNLESAMKIYHKNETEQNRLEFEKAFDLAVDNRYFKTQMAAIIASDNKLADKTEELKIVQKQYDDAVAELKQKKKKEWEEYKKAADVAWQNVKDNITPQENERQRQAANKAVDGLFDLATGGPSDGWNTARLVLDLVGVGDIVGTIQNLASADYWKGKGSELKSIVTSIIPSADPYAGKTINEVKLNVWTTPYVNVHRGWEGTMPELNLDEDGSSDDVLKLVNQAIRMIGGEDPVNIWNESHKQVEYTTKNFGLNQQVLKKGMNYWEPTEQPKPNGGHLLDPVRNGRWFFIRRNPNARDFRGGPFIAMADAEFMQSKTALGRYNSSVTALIQSSTSANHHGGSLDVSASMILPTTRNLAENINKTAKSSKVDYHRWESEAIQRLLKTGPDLFSNQFDMFFVYEPGFNHNAILPIQLDYTNIEQNLLNGNVLATRISSIGIPSISRTPGSTSILMRTVPRRSSTVNAPKESSFTMDMDENLYFLDYFNRMAGHSSKYNSKETKLNSDSKIVKALNDTGIQIHGAPVMLLNQLSKVFVAERTDTKKRKQMEPLGLCIIVKEQHFSLLADAKYATTESRLGSPFWIFENVKLLGTSDAIEFDSADAGSPGQFTFNFIFRRHYRINNFYTNNIEDKVLKLKGFEDDGLPYIDGNIPRVLSKIPKLSL